MKMKPVFLPLLACMAALAMVLPSRADLTHRYSFTSDANDSVGTANGTVQGGVTVSGGQAVFDGNSGSFIDLPPGMVSNYTSLTVEFWISPGANGNWCELYAFGNRDSSGAGGNMLMFTPHSGAGDFRMSFSDVDPGYNHEFVVTQPGVLDNLGPIHIACVYKPDAHFMGLYTNGVLAASRSDLGTFFKLSAIHNVHSWLGQSLYAPDAPYTGSIDEFRVYDTAQNAIQIAGSFVAGPDALGSDPGAPTNLKVTVKSPLIKGASATASAIADFSKISGVTLAGVTDVTYASSNTNIFTVDTNGVVKGTGVGAATLTVSYQGKTASQAVNITSGQATALIHRYSFTTDATDSAGTANGTLVDGATIVDGAVVMDGTGGYVDLPNNLFTNLDSVTFEAWVTDQGSANWARIWDFGNSVNGEDQQGGGVQYMFLSLPAGPGNLRGAYTITGGGAGEQVVEWAGTRPPVGQKTHIVWTSDAAFQTGKLFVNGLLVGVNTSMTLTPRDLGPTVNDWLGKSQFNDPAFNGSIDEFRIYSGAITPLQVAVDAAIGPDSIVSNPGTLKSLQLTIGTNQVFFGGLPVQALLLATYSNVTNLNVTTLDGVVFSSSDAKVAAVSAQGSVVGTGLGTATLSASFGGKTNTLSVTVTAPPGWQKPVLVHRYSFGDAVGSKVAKDSVGSADGDIRGAGAAFDGAGHLNLPGGTGSDADISAIAGYVELPNGIISALTDLSIETWVTWQGSGSWQRIFDFGTSTGGEDVSNGGGNYLFLSPQGPNALRFSVRDPATGAEPSPLTAPGPLTAGVETLVTVTYDFTANVASLYSNAVLVAQSTAPVAITGISDVNNWLGRSQWPDAILQGQFNEFRIWNGVLLPDQVASNFAAGPDSLEALPKLAAAVNGTSVVVSWSSSASGFKLQGSPALGSKANWQVVSGSVSTQNGVSSVSVPLSTGPAQFFRLTK